MRKSAAFTLLEVMVAVSVLALSATAAIKLVLMAQNTLSAVKEREELLNSASAIEAGIIAKELDDQGTSGDISWELSDKEKESFGEDFGRLNFDNGGSADLQESEALKWRELTVKNKNDRIITLLLPSKEQEEKSGEKTSEDKTTGTQKKSGTADGSTAASEKTKN